MEEEVQAPPSHPAQHIPLSGREDRDRESAPKHLRQQEFTLASLIHISPLQESLQRDPHLMVSLCFSCCWIHAEARGVGSVCTGSGGCREDCCHPGMALSLQLLQALLSSPLPPRSQELLQRGQPALKPNSAFSLTVFHSMRVGIGCQATVVSADCVCGGALGIPDF